MVEYGAPVDARTAGEIEAWLTEYLARVLEIDPAQVDTTLPFDSYGLSSAAAYELMGELQTWLGIEFDPTLPYDYPTIVQLSAHLASVEVE